MHLSKSISKAMREREREFGRFEKEGKLMHTVKKLDRETQRKVKKGVRVKKKKKKIIKN
jgi:hypothetical protein